MTWQTSNSSLHQVRCVIVGCQGVCQGRVKVKCVLTQFACFCSHVPLVLAPDPG